MFEETLEQTLTFLRTAVQNEGFTAFLALVLSAIAFFNSLIDRRRQRRREARLDRANRFTSREDYFRGLTDWGFRALDGLSAAVHLVDSIKDEPTKSWAAELNTRRAVLSALIDQGRLYFPNLEMDKGTNKEAAYRGHRHEVLDYLVYAYDVLTVDVAQGDYTFARKKLVKHQRAFTSIMQQIVDPRTRRKEFGDIFAK